MIGIGKMKADHGEALKGEEVQILSEVSGKGNFVDCLIEARNKRVTVPRKLIDEDNA